MKPTNIAVTFIPIALPLSSSGNTRPSNAMDVPKIMAAPTPVRARAK